MIPLVNGGSNGGSHVGHVERRFFRSKTRQFLRCSFEAFGEQKEEARVGSSASWCINPFAKGV